VDDPISAAGDERPVDPSDDRPAPPRSASVAPAVADGVERPVDPAWVTTDRIGAAIGSAAIGSPVAIAATAVAAGVGGAPTWVRAAVAAGAAATIVLLVAATIALPGLRYRHLRYRVDPAGLGIRRGIWWRTEARVSRGRVQHTDVTQGPVERAFGIATLVVFTAGTEHARVALPGLPEARARQIRDFLVVAGEDDGV